MKFHSLRNFLFGTLRGRLILSVALIHAIMMTLFIADLTIRQRAMLLDRQTESAVAMSEALATSAAEWIAADDLSGLQELVEAQRRYSEMNFVVITDKTGHILAHTDKTKIGLYVLDLPRDIEQKIMSKSHALVDVAVPAMLNNTQVGWVRVGLGQKTASEKLAQITFIGIFYALAATIIGSLIAWQMGRLITKRLYAIQDTISEVKKGVRTARSKVAGNDEAASIAHEFNSMLDTLATREAELSASESRFKKLFDTAAVPLCFVNKDGVLVNFNRRFLQTFGYTHEDMPTLNEWWQHAYPDPMYREWVITTWNDAVKRAEEERNDIEPIEYNVTCKNGESRTMVISGTTLDNDLLATFFDITERKQATDALQEREKHSQSLLRLSRRLESAQTYREALNAAHDEVKTIVGYQNLWVYLLSKDGKFFRSLVADGDRSETIMSEDGTATLAIEGDPMLEEIASAKEIVLIEDAQIDPRTNKEIARKLGNRTLINVPIILFDRHLGSVGMGTFRDEGVRIPTTAEQEYLKSMASHLAVSLDRIHLSLERKLAEEALRKSNILLEQIFSATEFMMAYMDADFNFIRVNRAYAEADERTPEYFIGKNHFALYPHPENEATFQKVVMTGEPHIAYAKPFEYTNNPARGITYWNWTLQPVKEPDGQVIGLVLSMVDVTEREKAIMAQRESDALYRTLIEQAGDGIFVANPQGRYIDVNPSGCTMLGYTREEILNMTMKDLASPQSQSKTPLRLPELRAGKSITSERTLVAKNGTLIPVEISGKALDNGNFLGIVRDITERKHHEIEREAIITVSNALRQANTRTEIVSVILDQLLKLFEADGAVLVLPDPQTGGLIDQMGRGIVGERMSGLNIPPGKGVCYWVMMNKKPYLSNKVDEDPLFYHADLLGQSHCIAAVPLITQERAIGALWIARQSNILDTDVSLLVAIADIASNAIHRVILHEQTEQQLHHLLALHQIDLAITTNLDSNLTLDIILNSVRDELEVDAASILLLDPVTYMLEHIAGIGFRTNRIKQTQIKLGDGTVGRAAQEYRTVSFPDLSMAKDTFSRYSLLADEEFASHFATPLVVKGQVKGVLEIFHRKTLDPTQEWLDYFETLATQAAVAIENASLVENLQRSNMELMLAYDATIEGWSRALDLRDKETEGHTQRVTEMALKLAEKMGMNNTEKIDLRRGALLHDIGKMGIPDSILHKPGTLTDDEWKIMQQHPSYAYQMLFPISYLKRAVEVSYCHHEKWDGSGYPRGLKGEEIPLAARLFAVVDVFDALTSDRPYRKAWSRQEACRYIEEQAGKHFNPHIAKIFVESKIWY
jgi:PAS domain S-box-containing protein/putative nucleotidyltransferase with HDIG domain